MVSPNLAVVYLKKLLTHKGQSTANLYVSLYVETLPKSRSLGFILYASESVHLGDAYATEPHIGRQRATKSDP